MKIFKCKVIGETDSDGCFRCYTNKHNQASYSSRVICKTENIVEEFSSALDEEPREVLEEAA